MTIFNHIARKVGPTVQERIDALKIGQKMQDLPEHLWHESFRFYVKEDPTRVGGPNIRLLRLDPKKPSLTVTGFVFNKFVHPYEDRFISVREAARLQGFPDDLEFKGSLTSTQQQVGNAVPVLLSKAVCEAVLAYAVKSGFKQNLSALSLFSGAGGMDIGAHQACANNLKIKTKLCIEYWKEACETLSGYFKNETAVVCQSVLNITDPKVFWKEKTGQDLGPDLIFGGPPCQSFSQAGKQKGIEDDRGNLIFDFLRFVEALQPSFFVIENVSNLKAVDSGRVLRKILETADNLGYNVNAGTLSAADFGAPQLRKRIFFLGCKKNLGKISLPFPTHSEGVSLFLKPYTTVGEAFASLPKLYEKQSSRQTSDSV
jgi:DNA (cytosine-5)-methyltransferase 1